MERFRTCDECSRHVRASETKCPFCGRALHAATLLQVPRAPTQLSRAQRLALVAAVAGGQLIAACGDDAIATPVYGAPIPRAGAGATAGTGAAASGGAAAIGGVAGRGAAGSPPMGIPVYGAPVPPAPGTGGSAGNAGTGGSAGK